MEEKRKYKKDEAASEVRKRLKSMEESRDDWKTKQKASQDSLKTLKKRMKETKSSRDGWQLKYHKAAAEAKDSKEKIEELEKELAQERIARAAAEEKLEVKKKANDTAQINDNPEGNASYSDCFKAICVFILLTTSIAVRGLTAVLNSLKQCIGVFGKKIPSHTSCRRWLNQVGYYVLKVLPVEQVNDWIFLVDNGIRIEKRKFCLVLGIRQSQLKKGQALSFKDMRVLAMGVINKNQEVEKLLEEAIAKAGIPIGICSDLGPDVMASIKKIQQKHPNIQHIPDMTHKTANLLKKWLEQDKSWNAFINNVNQSKNRLKQSILSFLCPPNIRGKSRFLNCKDVVHWALRIIKMLEATSKEDPNYDVMHEKLGWTLTQSKEIEFFYELFELAAIAKELIRKLHMDKNTYKYAKGILKEASMSKKGKKFADELLSFMKEQGKKAAKGMCLLGCSEIIESAMSKLKLLDRENGSNGYTRSILGLAACFGPMDHQAIMKAFKVVSEKQVEEWAEQHIGQTIQTKRRQALKNLSGKKLGAKLDRLVEEKIMVA